MPSRAEAGQRNLESSGGTMQGGSARPAQVTSSSVAALAIRCMAAAVHSCRSSGAQGVDHWSSRSPVHWQSMLFETFILSIMH